MKILILLISLLTTSLSFAQNYGVGYVPPGAMPGYVPPGYMPMGNSYGGHVPMGYGGMDQRNQRPYNIYDSFGTNRADVTESIGRINTLFS